MIQKERICQKFEELDPAAQRRVARLIETLCVRGRRPSSIPAEPIGSESFVGIWRDREDLSDATDSARPVRLAEWDRDK